MFGENFTLVVTILTAKQPNKSWAVFRRFYRSRRPSGRTNTYATATVSLSGKAVRR